MARSLDKCQETKWVNIGRWGETRPCDNPGKFEVVATKDGKGFKTGDTIHVCGVHKRAHEHVTAREDKYAAKVEKTKQIVKTAAEFNLRAAGGVAPYYNTQQGEYESSRLLVSRETLERLLTEAGR